MYAADLAYIHHAGFSAFARRAAPEIVRILRAHGVRSGLIVDAGCGSGVVSRHLVDAGYDVAGVDASRAMIQLARAHVPEATFRVASIETAAFPACQAIVAVGEVVSYAASLRGFLRAARRSLPAGGLLVFDFIESAARRTYPPKGIVSADWALAVRADASRGGRTLTRHIVTSRWINGRWRRRFEVHRVRIRTRAEMSRLLAAAGFRAAMSRAYGRYRLMAGDVAVVAEKH